MLKHCWLQTVALTVCLLSLTLLVHAQQKGLSNKYQIKQQKVQISKLTSKSVSSEKADGKSFQSQTILSGLKTVPQDQVTIEALKKEMDANLKNPNYNLNRAFSLIKGSGKIIYSLKHYDPDFPLVFATGNKIQDAKNYNEAKMIWAEKKKADLKKASR